MSTIYSFSAICKKDARVLILGSMPGKESLRQNRYYAHPRNSFWFIAGNLFGFDPALDYQERTGLLAGNGIALWDVLKACDRKGSLDSAIDGPSVVANNFNDFYASHPAIEFIFFNGARAEQEYMKHVHSGVADTFGHLQYKRLPSTSPAHAAMSRDDKLSNWQAVTDCLHTPLPR